MPRAFIEGEVVDIEAKGWDFDGKSGMAYAAFLRQGSLRDGAQRVKVTPKQYSALSIGDRVTWPVSVFGNDRGGTRVVLQDDFVPAPGGNGLLISDLLTTLAA